MIELARFEARRHVKQALGVGVGMFGFVLLIVMVFPAMEEAGQDLQEIFDAMPESVLATVGGQVPFHTIEGFLVVEVYRMIWMLIVGSYLAYAAATLVAGELESGSIDTLLMTPMPRRRIVAEKFLSMVPDVVFISLSTFVGVLAGAWAVGEEIDLFWLAVLHVVSVPYLLTCVSFGLLVSVLVATSARRAQIVAFAGVAAMYMLEAVTRDTDYERLGDLLFPRYFDPNAILISNEVSVVDTGVLLVVTLSFLLVAAAVFERIDVAT